MDGEKVDMECEGRDEKKLDLCSALLARKDSGRKSTFYMRVCDRMPTTFPIACLIVENITSL